MTTTPAPASESTSPLARRSPGLLYGAQRIFAMSLVQMLWSRRTVFMVLVVGLPVVIALVLRLLFEAGVPFARVGRGPVAGPVIFGFMMWGFFVRLSIPVLAIFYGTSLMADEVEDKTLTYLFTRPIPRGSVLLGKYLAYLLCTVSVVLPAVMLVWLLIVPIGARLGPAFPSLLKDLALLALGLAVYGAVFALAGSTLKRPLVFGLVFVFGWEMLVIALPGYLKKATVAYYLQGLVPHAMPADSTADVLTTFFREVPTLTESLLGLAVIGVVALTFAVRAVGRREYVLEQ
jgi:ABC-type transport system involved in multi-copper enzyme maturation permease subunit